MFNKLIEMIENWYSKFYSRFSSRIKVIRYSISTFLFGRKDYVKFIVMTRSRTGSNLLISLLNSHKNINAQGEIFRRLNGRNAQNILSGIFPKKSLHKCFGFKLFYYHPLDSSQNDYDLIWKQITSDRSIKIIHLTRENLLRVHVSRLIAGKTDDWANAKITNVIKDKTVKVDPSELIKDIETTKNYILKTRRLFEHHDVLEITYEDLINNRQDTLDLILNHLNQERLMLQSDLIKQNPEKLDDLISNYNEVKEVIQNSKYYSMLNNN